MAQIDSKTVFVTTSPRTPAKMIPEIVLLNRHFHGQKWNSDSQRAFMEILKEEDFFLGKGENDPAFGARDRINRAPQMLGFVVLHPNIELTPAGKALHNNPLPITALQKMVEDVRKANYIPSPEQIRRLFDYSKAVAAKCYNENE